MAPPVANNHVRTVRPNPIESARPNAPPLRAAALGLSLLACTGCYDSHALVDQVRTDALRNRLHEVDLGTYRTTMPRDPKTNLLMEMELHLFGTVPQYRIHSIENGSRATAIGFATRLSPRSAKRAATSWRSPI